MKFLKGAIIFLSGAGIGAFCGVIFAKEKYKKEADDEVLEIRRQYAEKASAFNKEEKLRLEEEFNKKEAAEIVKEQGYVSYSTKSEPTVTVSNRLEDILKSKMDRKMDYEYPRDDYPEQPFMIQEEDFSETELGFEKISASYFLDDGMLIEDGELNLEDRDDVHLNINDCIGFDNLEIFLNDENMETMYIRNAKQACDYEVTKAGGSWSSIIGIGGEDDDEF